MSGMSLFAPGAMRGQCATLIRHARVLLERSGRPGTVASLRSLLGSLPSRPRDVEDDAWQRTFCGRCMVEMDWADDGHLAALDYFAEEVPRLGVAALRRLTESVLGVLEGLGLDDLAPVNPGPGAPDSNHLVNS